MPAQSALSVVGVSSYNGVSDPFKPTCRMVSHRKMSMPRVPTSRAAIATRMIDHSGRAWECMGEVVSEEQGTQPFVSPRSERLVRSQDRSHTHRTNVGDRVAHRKKSLEFVSLPTMAGTDVTFLLLEIRVLAKVWTASRSTSGRLNSKPPRFNEMDG